jgi:hypothetical protein
MIKVYKVYLYEGANPYIVSSLKEVFDFMECDITEMPNGEEGKIIVEITYITEEAYNNLSDWEGP